MSRVPHKRSGLLRLAAAVEKKPADLLAEWRALTPSQWEAPSPHKPLADGAEPQKRPGPTAWQMGNTFHLHS